MKIVLRNFKKEDENFIYATYLRNRYYHAQNDTTLSKDTWMKAHHNRLEKMFQEAKVAIHIACLSDDPDTILGYRIFNDERFSYIKKDWRGIGIEKLFKGDV
jgi:hypothetical protein